MTRAGANRRPRSKSCAQDKCHQSHQWPKSRNGPLASERVTCDAMLRPFATQRRRQIRNRTISSVRNRADLPHGVRLRSAALQAFDFAYDNQSPHEKGSCSMIDQFRPGWYSPAGSWLYLLQDKLFPPAIPHTAAWIPTVSSEVETPDGALFGILADPNARRDQIGPARSRPAGGTLDLPAATDSLSAGAPHWLQTVIPFGAGSGASEPQSNPRPRGCPRFPGPRRGS